MTNIINPFGNLEGVLEDINLFYFGVEFEGNDYSLKRLKEAVESAIKGFSLMTKEEKEAARLILEEKYPRKVASGESFNELYLFIESIETKENWEPEIEDLSCYKMRRFRENREERSREDFEEEVYKLRDSITGSLMGILGNILKYGGSEK